MQTIDAKTIVTANKSDIWFGTNYTMNIYKGCCHGCIYCDSRSECYGVEDFDTVRIKRNALEIIERELRSKRRTGLIATGSMSDPYNPFEKQLELTRGALRLVERYGFGVTIATKSSLVLRDVDILKRIARRAPAVCKITITCADDDLAAKIEPNVSRPSERFETIRALSDAGICCGVLLMPVLPFITDNAENISEIARKAGECGAKFIYPAYGVTLRANQRQHFYNMLDERFAELKEKYIEYFGDAYECGSPNARELSAALREQCGRFGMAHRMPDIIELIKSPYDTQQTTLF